VKGEINPVLLEKIFKHKDKLNKKQIVDKIGLISIRIHLKNCPLKKEIYIRLLKLLIKDLKS
jgi:hypothetical protein